MANGMSIPAEQLPAKLATECGVFQLGSGAPGALNALTCRSQRIALPKGSFNRVYLLAAATADTTGEFAAGASKATFEVPEWTGFIGQYDDRVWGPGVNNLTGLKAGFIKRTPVAWFSTHRHIPEGNDPYHFSYLFKFSLPIASVTDTLVLPANDKIKVFAVNVARSSAEDVVAAQPLYDDFANWGPVTLRPRESTPQPK